MTEPRIKLCDNLHVQRVCNRHGWLIRDTVGLANSCVLLSADWPGDFLLIMQSDRIL